MDQKFENIQRQDHNLNCIMSIDDGDIKYIMLIGKKLSYRRFSWGIYYRRFGVLLTWRGQMKTKPPANESAEMIINFPAPKQTMLENYCALRFFFGNWLQRTHKRRCGEEEKTHQNKIERTRNRPRRKFMCTFITHKFYFGVCACVCVHLCDRFIYSFIFMHN